MHQDICEPHLQHTILLGINPTSFKNCTPMLCSLNKNTRNNLFGTPLVPSVGRLYVIAGTYGLAAICCWYVAMIDVALVSVIVHKVFCKFLLEPTPLGQHQRNLLDYTMNPLDNTTGIHLQH